MTAGSSTHVAGVPAVRSSFSTVTTLGDTALVIGGYDEEIRLTRTFLRLPASG